jgi:DNA-binding LytR/AlgR family response regulator
MNTAPTAVLADDEDLPRAELRRMLARPGPSCRSWPNVNTARRRWRPSTHQPDIAFLDIRMPGLSGLDVARAVSGRCHCVFTTAYDSHAVAAFDAGAVDYLLKPIAADRLAQAVAACANGCSAQQPRPTWTPGAATGRRSCGQPGRRDAGHRAPLRWLSASVGDTIKMFSIDEVLFFQSDEKYTRVVTAHDEAHVRKPLRSCPKAWTPRCSGRCTAAWWCAPAPLHAPSATRWAASPCTCASTAETLA